MTLNYCVDNIQYEIKEVETVVLMRINSILEEKYSVNLAVSHHGITEFINDVWFFQVDK